MKKRNKSLICFIGIDGTGKTTLAHRLKQELNQKGIKSDYVMGRFENFKLLQPARWIIKKVLLTGKNTDQSPEGISTKRRLFKNRLLAGIWQYSLLSDYLVQLGYKIRLPLMRGKSICADRYIYDTVVDLTVDTALSGARMHKLLNHLFSLSPHPDVVFLIDLPEEIAFQHNLIKQDNISLDYLRARRGLYLSFSKRPEVVILDGSQKPDEIFQAVVKKLKERQILV